MVVDRGTSHITLSDNEVVEPIFSLVVFSNRFLIDFEIALLHCYKIFFHFIFHFLFGSLMGVA